MIEVSLVPIKASKPNKLTQPLGVFNPGCWVVCIGEELNSIRPDTELNDEQLTS